jgi:hypothetical protein
MLKFNRRNLKISNRHFSLFSLMVWAIVSYVGIKTTVWIEKTSSSRMIPAHELNAEIATPIGFTDFERSQQALDECAMLMRNSSRWDPTLAIEPNLIFVWVGPHYIPERALYGIVSGAVVYGPKWRIILATDNPINADILDRTQRMLANHGCREHSRLHHEPVTLPGVVEQLGE